MKKNVAIVGGGTAGLFLAAFLNPELFNVTIYEKKPALGRKFLVAGDGGFNLTHSEETSTFISRYTPSTFLAEALSNFSNDHMRNWLSKLGIPTFVGSSGRVFPEKGIKPIHVLKRFEEHLIEKKVNIELNKTFTGWSSDNTLIFQSGEIIQADFIAFALGGASWKVTGSDGNWLDTFDKKGIPSSPFLPSNCAYHVSWSETFIQKHEGTPLKNITVSIQDKTQKGEAVVTKFGIEGNAIYALSPEIQSALSQSKTAEVYVDFKPTFDEDELVEKIKRASSNTTKILRDKLKLPLVVLDLIKSSLTKDEYLNPELLAKNVKHFPLTLTNSAPIDEAISTSGGVPLEAVNSEFELKNIKNSFCIGEMLDWDAPTGGYLIQACASMGVHLAEHLNKKH